MFNVQMLCAGHGDCLWLEYGHRGNTRRILIDAGFRLEKVLPVDQFLWSPHVELVGVFNR